MKRPTRRQVDVLLFLYGGQFLCAFNFLDERRFRDMRPMFRIEPGRLVRHKFVTPGLVTKMALRGWIQEGKPHASGYRDSQWFGITQAGRDAVSQWIPEELRGWTS